MKKVKWVDLGDNEVLKGKGFFISYNPDTSASKSGLGAFFNSLGSLVGGLEGIELEADGRAETALVIEKNSKKIFKILNGDFRKEYEKVFSGGLKACEEVYEKNIKHRSNWSTDKLKS